MYRYCQPQEGNERVRYHGGSIYLSDDYQNIDRQTGKLKGYLKLNVHDLLASPDEDEPFETVAKASRRPFSGVS